MRVDVLIVGDFRFPGGTSTAIASEVTALVQAGYRVGLMAIAAPLLSSKRHIHMEISALLRNGSVTAVPQGTAVRTRLCCLHHPSVFEAYPATPPRVSAERTILILHHPPVDALGVSQFDLRAVARVTVDMFGKVTWAPVGPKVRAALKLVPDASPLIAMDWVNVIDPDRYVHLSEGLPGVIPVIGRHSRPEAVKWPDTKAEFLGAYPDAPDLRVRLMGFGPDQDKLIGRRPANWDVLAFGMQPVAQFLASIDYFSYFHGRSWVEAFGRSILEAMAAGRVCLLPQHFEEVFGEGAVYLRANQVADTVRSLHADPAAHARQAAQGVAVVRDRYGPDHAVRRVRDLIGPPGTALSKPDILSRDRQKVRKPRVLYLTSNGVGMGHLTRAMASARRLRPEVEPIIVTMSKAFGVAHDHGMMVEYLPFFRSVGMRHAEWSRWLSAEMTDVLDLYRPDVFVFDGNVPYDGMLEAIAPRSDLWKIWMRRGMWRPGAGADIIGRQDQFDVVIEPGEIAAEADRGLTVRHRHLARHVAPVRFLRDEELLSREAAKALIGLDQERPAVFLQLGSGNNFETAGLVHTIRDSLRSGGMARDAQIVFGVWQISARLPDMPRDVTVFGNFPFARFLNAFDFAVALAGYNTFHENLAARLPTLFLSNDHPEHDEQGQRAAYGNLRGLCLAAGSRDPAGIARGLEELSERGAQDRIRRACGRLPTANGADEVATFLAELAVTRKTLPGNAQAAS